MGRFSARAINLLRPVLYPRRSSAAAPEFIHLSKSPARLLAPHRHFDEMGRSPQDSSIHLIVFTRTFSPGRRARPARKFRIKRWRATADRGAALRQSRSGDFFKRCGIARSGRRAPRLVGSLRVSNDRSGADGGRGAPPWRPCATGASGKVTKPGAECQMAMRCRRPEHVENGPLQAPPGRA